MSTLTRLLMVTMLFGCCVPSGAALVYMQARGELAIDATTYRIVQGATYEIEIWMDFTGDVTLGGGYDVVFNEEAFDFVSWSPGSIGDPQFTSEPDVLDGLLQAGIGDFNGMTGPALMAVATFTLTDAAALGPVPTMTTAASSGPAGPWISANTFYCCQDVDYYGLEFVVPVPAAFWLMGSGLVALLGLRRGIPGYRFAARNDAISV